MLTNGRNYCIISADGGSKVSCLVRAKNSVLYYTASMIARNVTNYSIP